MRLLILGGGGMLGHKLWLTAGGSMECFATVRSAAAVEALRRPTGEVIAGVDANDFDSIVRAVADVRPDAVVNCIGIVKQLDAAKDPITSIAINSLFPHRLARLCRAAGARLIHISTDCVFSGARGNYVEADVPDAADLYGRSKQMGEPGEGALTLRTSIIGRELSTTSGLVEWFLSNRGGRVEGFTAAVFSGLTTAALSRVILDVIQSHSGLSGVYHVSAERISKFDLVTQLNAAFHAGITIEASERVRIDRSLNSSRFRAATGFAPPTWSEMIVEMANDPVPYDDWRKQRGSRR
jgi:dTDP-4-dehydrorhamnose reductase